MTRRNIDIPDDLWRWVSVEAAKHGKSKREIVIVALERYCEVERIDGYGTRKTDIL